MSTAYRADIDGLRALAVLLVVFGHAQLGCKGGYIGVDVFFVISGYLITGLVLHQKFRLQDFWMRRLRRIFPALALVVLVSVLVGYGLLRQPEFQALSYSVLAQLGLGANFYFWQTTGYFAGSAQSKPLLHTWSLAVEEQFYLIYPMLLLGFTRGRRLALGVLVVTSLALSGYGAFGFPDATFYLLPTRCWELALGGLIAVLELPPASKWQSECGAWIGLMAILLPAVVYTERTVFPGFAAIPPCAGTAMLLICNRERTSVGRILSMRGPVFIGLISYSLYLWHWPILVYVGYWEQPLRLQSKWFVVGLSGLLAVVSWRWVETPIRRRRLLKDSRTFLAFVGGTATLLACLALILPPRIAPETLDTGWNLETSEVADAVAGRFPTLGIHREDAPLDFILWGDSHATALSTAVDLRARQAGRKGVIAARHETPPLLGIVVHGKYALNEDCIPYNQAVLDFIRKNRIPNVILAARWTTYENRNLDEVIPHTLTELDRLGCDIWWVGQVPDQRENVPRLLQRAKLRGEDPSQQATTRQEHQSRVAHIQLLLNISGTPRLHILDAADYFFENGDHARLTLDGQSLYRDEGHLSPHGARQLVPLFDPVFESREQD